MEETGKPLGVDALILYVNNEIQDPSTELGRLMHDFSCVDADDMYSELLAERTRKFKNTEEGRSIMSTVWKEAMSSVRKETQEETAQREREAMAVRMLKNGESEDKTVLYSSLPLAVVQKLAQVIALGAM